MFLVVLAYRCSVTFLCQELLGIGRSAASTPVHPTHAPHPQAGAPQAQQQLPANRFFMHISQLRHTLTHVRVTQFTLKVALCLMALHVSLTRTFERHSLEQNFVFKL